MKRYTRKFLSVLTALTCLTSAASMTVFAVDNDVCVNEKSTEGLVSLPYNPNSSNTTLTTIAVSSTPNDCEKISTVTAISCVTVSTTAVQADKNVVADNSEFGELAAMISGFIEESGLAARTFVDEEFFDGVVVEIQEYWNQGEILTQIKDYIAENNIDESKVEFFVLENSFAEVPDNIDTTEEHAIIEQLICEYFGDSDLKIGNIYKSYAMDGLYNENYFEAESFESLICGEVRTYVEVGDQLLTLLEKDGELKVVGETLQVGKSVIELSAESDKINSELDSVISETKFCNFPMLRLAVIYYKDIDGAEFVRPYIENPYGDYTGVIENGKLYSAKEFLNQMKLVFDISGYDPDANIGIPDTYIIGDANGDYSVDVRYRTTKWI